MTTQQRQQYWQQQLADWRASERSGAAFCKQYALSYHQFSYWRRKLAGDEPAQPEVPPGFARVTATQDLSAPTALTLTLPGGIAITGLHAGNVELLGAILRQLR